MSKMLVLAATDISSSPVLFKKFRGKTAKEIYRCGKGIALTGSFAKPVALAAATIPAELGKGFLYSAVGQVGESVIGYVSGIGFVRYIYKVAQPTKIKATARLVYNVACLPMTIYSKGWGAACDYIGISKVEEYWFGSPVYIFDDNRVWAEKNFSISDIFEGLED